MKGNTGFEIAVIGMSGRFPGAENIASFWNNIKNGKETISFFTDEELMAAGEDPSMINNPEYVKAAGVLEDKEFFDSPFFNYRSDEARLMDPQMRILHECVWQAIEDAGYDLNAYKNRIGLFIGTSPNLNWECYAAVENAKGILDKYSASLLQNADMSSTRIAYQLNLRGPSMAVYTGCSTSLVAIHQACNSLLLGECTIAVAGGASVNNHSKRGYLYKEGMILSKDGHCRTFDADSTGTVGGEGVGIVVLKRLKNALADKDNILAVIKGTGINNDGKDKVGYTAPGVKGQAEAIMMARKMTGIEPESIGYVEAHGTATKLGDSVEVEALTLAFGKSKDKYCALGSIKSNIGHLDAAAGVAGFIKTVLALKNKQIPPSLNFTTPNPEINFKDGPFYVNRELKKWTNNGYPLTAGVSSFGIGGTNAHMILQEPPPQEPSSESRDHQLLVFSAKTKTALERNIANFATYLKQNDSDKLADVAYTLTIGRTPMLYRKAIVCKNRAEALEMLRPDAILENIAFADDKRKKPVVFMFSGQGSQYMSMCSGLYCKEEAFKEEMDKCLDLAEKISGKDLRRFFCTGAVMEDLTLINDTEFTQPVLFILEYSLARLLMKWGIFPDIMIGHSIGEYVAACIGGAFTLEDALTLVIKRGQLMQRAPKGVMLSVSASEKELRISLEKFKAISLAAVNSSSLCVVAGEEKDITDFKEEQENNGYKTRPIRTSHAFHSSMMDGILNDFKAVVEGISAGSLKIPIVSNLTGKYITQSQVESPRYWVDHLRHTVLFSSGVETLLLENKEGIFVEVGPGKILSAFVQSNQLYKESHKVITLVRHATEIGDDLRYLLMGIGQLWLNGANPAWGTFYEKENRRKATVPVYSFDKIGHPTYVDAQKLISDQLKKAYPVNGTDIENAVQIPVWQHSIAPNEAVEMIKQSHGFLVFCGKEGFAFHLIRYLVAAGQNVIEVRQAKSFRRIGAHAYEVNLSDRFGLKELWACLDRDNIVVNKVLYCPTLTLRPSAMDYDQLGEALSEGYLGLSFLARSIEDRERTGKLELTIVANYLANVMGTDVIDPLKAAVHGPARIMPVEMSNVKCKVVDIPYPFDNSIELNEYLHLLINEIFYEGNEPFVAYRYKERWTQAFQEWKENEKLRSEKTIEQNGTYIITGGMGGMGFTIAGDLVQQHAANVILLHRSDLPEREKWDQWLLVKGEKDPMSKKIRRIREMEAVGCRIDLIKVDVASEEQVKSLAVMLKGRYSRINGIIWAAGEVDFGGIILKRPEKDFIRYISSKIHGLLLFKKYFDFKDLDFIVLFSSMANVFYHLKFGQVAYNAANSFFESFPDYAKRAFGIRVLAINWSDWQDTGMAFRTVQRHLKTDDSQVINSQLMHAVSPKEGLEIFHKCLRAKSSVFAIHKGDILEAVQYYKMEFARKAEIAGQSAMLMNAAKGQTATVMERLVRIFCQFFERADISADADFYELGGDSLKAVTIIARIRNEFSVDLPVKEFFSRTTLNELTKLITLLEATAV